MLKYIENLLYEKTKDTQSQILYAQWNYDKKIIPEILQTISNIFPHYSLHDETHSITIINNIVRVLGKENIEKLSAIDLWLILEASYKHDIGMAISAHEIQETLKSEDFISFFKNILRDKKHSLYQFASQFKIKNTKIKYKKKHLDLQLHDGIKFVLAEYYRSQHSQRSKKIIESHNKEFDLGNNETLIPKRIFKILGAICDSHTQNFEDVMKLSFSEVGIDTEDAHPRFVACMLRIGDLLDLDNNRFSDVMLRTLHKIPLDTLKHKDKHLAIESFRADRKIISITARCDDYEVANIAQHWFNYLNDEISNQMIKWNEIVPSKEFGYLPTIGDLRVELKRYDFIDGKNKPQFKIDTEKALALLQGAGIYENAYQSIREILQNAVDATLVRIWLEHGGTKDFSTPKSQDFLELLFQYPITINIKEEKTTNKHVEWKIEIEDCGIGIASDDLKYLMTTGSSSRNKRKRDIIDSMPSWMKPSGTFGIGFQSIFMLTEQVIIETKSFFDEQYQVVELNSPSSQKNGAILVEKKKSNHKKKVGTKITFLYKTKKMPNSYSIPSDHKLMKSVKRLFDPIVDKSFDIEIASVIDKASLTSSKSYIPLVLYFNKEIMIDSKIETIQPFDYFSKKQSMEISLVTSHSTRVFYKNQFVNKNELPSFDFLNFDINILGDDASKALTIDRNSIRKEYNKKLTKKVFDSAFEYLTKKYKELKGDQKILTSIFLTYYNKSFYNSSKEVDKYDAWKNYTITIESVSYSLGDLFNEITVLEIIQTNVYGASNERDIFTYKKEDNKFIIDIREHSNAVTSFILSIISKYFTTVVFDMNNDKEIFYKEKKEHSFSENDIYQVLKKQKNYDISRVKIPCLAKYEKLRLKDNADKSWLRELNVNIYGIKVPSMLSPYFSMCKDEDYMFSCRDSKLEYRVNDKVIKWVYKNRFDKKTTKAEIKSAYKQFNADIDIEKVNNEAK